MIIILAVLLFSTPETTCLEKPIRVCGLWFYLQAVPDLLDSVDVIWKKIGNDQAIQTTEDVENKTRKLWREKEKFGADIEQNRIGSMNDFDQRIEAIIRSDLALTASLDKFAHEISEALTDKSQDLRNAVNSFMSTKLEDLYEAREVWQPNNHDSQHRAAIRMSKATSCMQAMNVAAACLAKSIRDHKRDESDDCKRETIQKAASMCVPDQIRDR